MILIKRINLPFWNRPHQKNDIPPSVAEMRHAIPVIRRGLLDRNFNAFDASDKFEREFQANVGTVTTVTTRPLFWPKIKEKFLKM